MTDEVVQRKGTWRTQTVEKTWERIRPILPEYGISRVSAVTGFDRLGIPVAVAVRPRALTLSTSQGKGISMSHALVSASMEAVELSCSENPRFEEAILAAANDLDLDYPLLSLTLSERALAQDPISTPQFWVQSESLVSGLQSWLPMSAVYLSSSPIPNFRPSFFQLSTNGLASGNTVPEAWLHGLLEVVERHVVASDGERTLIDARSVPSDPIQRLLDAGRIDVSVEQVANPFGVAVYECCVVSEDFPIPAVGSGAHIDPMVAVQRAVTEAVQARLTAIVGTREDLNPDAESTQQAPFRAASTKRQGQAWNGIVSQPRVGVSEYVGELSQRVAAFSGVSPFAVTLHERPELAVVRVVAPGMVFAGKRAPA